MTFQTASDDRASNAALRRAWALTGLIALGIL